MNFWLIPLVDEHYPVHPQNKTMVKGKNKPYLVTNKIFRRGSSQRAAG